MIPSARDIKFSRKSTLNFMGLFVSLEIHTYSDPSSLRIYEMIPSYSNLNQPKNSTFTEFLLSLKNETTQNGVVAIILKDDSQLHENKNKSKLI